MRVRRSFTAAGRGRGRRFGAWLGIAALLLQLLVAANHFHPEDFAAPTKAPGLHALPGSAPGSFPGQSGAPAHEDCGLCFTLQLVSSAAPAAPPSLPEPSPVGLRRIAAQRDYHVAAAPYLLFQTRAPPLA
jgi:hypothetical protein